jgi:hypothetical protein
MYFFKVKSFEIKATGQDAFLQTNPYMKALLQVKPSFYFFGPPVGAQGFVETHDP